MLFRLDTGVGDHIGIVEQLAGHFRLRIGQARREVGYGRPLPRVGPALDHCGQGVAEPPLISEQGRDLGWESCDVQHDSKLVNRRLSESVFR